MYILCVAPSTTAAFANRLFNPRPWGDDGNPLFQAHHIEAVVDRVGRC
jgi:hypothetical protein